MKKLNLMPRSFRAAASLQNLNKTRSTPVTHGQGARCREWGKKIQQYKNFCFGFMLLCGGVNASTSNFDIYGVDGKTQDKILACCEEGIQKYIALKEKTNFTPAAELEKIVPQTEAQEKQVLKKINALGNFSFSHFSTIYYPQDNVSYTTLDIVQAGDSQRLPGATKRVIKKPLKKSKKLAQLFKVWQAYLDHSQELMQQHAFDFESKSCPFVHCAWGFDKKEYKNLVPKLKSGAKRYKNQLTQIIKYGNDDRERENAIFLLANTKDYKDVAKLLINFSDDASEGVRNNAMRVLGSILEKHKLPKLDSQRIIKALNYPYVTDRNKAAYVLFNIVKQNKAVHKQVIQESGDNLIALLKLKQPNNHAFAHEILKALSGKNYAARDYPSWEKWLATQKTAFQKA